MGFLTTLFCFLMETVFLIPFSFGVQQSPLEKKAESFIFSDETLDMPQYSTCSTTHQSQISFFLLYVELYFTAELLSSHK